jgi:hypothetical protein
VISSGNGVSSARYRGAKLFPDALGRSPKPLKFIAVDDHLKLKDATNEIDIFHVSATTIWPTV